jgi:predicted nucleic acid-binding protein
LTPIFVDTAFLIALVNRRDKYHEVARRLAAEYDGYPLLLTDSILLEAGNALARHFRREGVAIIEQLLTAAEVEVVYSTPALFAAAFDRYKQHVDKEWGMVDCISFEVMQARGITEALTPDRHFAQAGLVVLMAAPP